MKNKQIANEVEARMISLGITPIEGSSLRSLCDQILDEVADRAPRIINLNGPLTLTESMEAAGFAAIEEYEQMKADQIFPRPSLIAFIWGRMHSARTALEGKK